MTMSDRRLRPLFDLAFNPAEIKNRLTSIPIFVVAHKDDSEFVLVSGEVWSYASVQICRGQQKAETWLASGYPIVNANIMASAHKLWLWGSRQGSILKEAWIRRAYTRHDLAVGCEKAILNFGMQQLYEGTYNWFAMLKSDQLSQRTAVRLRGLISCRAAQRKSPGN